MNLIKDEQKIGISRTVLISKDLKGRKKSSRRYLKRLFASAGFFGRTKKALVLFFALAALTFALCMMAPGTQNLKGQQTIQSTGQNNSDSVLKN